MALPRGVSGDGRSDARRSPVGSATADPVDRYDLSITDHGLVVGAVGGFTTPIPALVPWSEVSSVTVNGVAELAGGSHGEILEIEVSDGGWSGDDRVQRFVVQATGLQAFVEAASSRRTLTEGPDSRDTGRGRGTDGQVRIVDPGGCGRHALPGLPVDGTLVPVGNPLGGADVPWGGTHITVAGADVQVAGEEGAG